MALAPLADAAGPGAGSESLAVSPATVFLRFDVAPLAEAVQVERAVLALSPAAGWRPSGEAQRLTVRAILGAWSTTSVSAGALPPVDSAPAGVVTLPARARGPVRVDVTSLVRAWAGGSVPVEGLALETTGYGIVFLGAGTAVQADRARLEVVYR